MALMKRLEIQSGETNYEYRQEPSERDSDHLANDASHWQMGFHDVKQQACSEDNQGKKSRTEWTKSSSLTVVMAEDWYVNSTLWKAAWMSLEKIAIIFSYNHSCISI